MSTKRQPSKQRRQSQNRQQRAAVQARSEAAAGSEAPTGKVGGDSSSAAPAQGGSVLSRLTGSGASSRKSQSKPSAAGGGQAPGHRAALTSLVLSAASVLFVLFAFRVPVSSATGDPIATKPDRVAEWSLASLDAAQRIDAGATADEVRDEVENWSPGGQEPYIKAFWPVSLSIFLPLIGAGLGFRAVSKRRPAKVVNRAMYVTLFGALLTTQLLVFFLPAVVALAIAAFQVRKAEVAAAGAGKDPDAAVDEIDDADEERVP